MLYGDGLEPYGFSFFTVVKISTTSIGANVRESKHAQSDADFLSKMSIAYKEADETDFWLNLLHDNGYMNDEQFRSLSHDCERILKILTSIVKTMKEKIEKGKVFAQK